MGDWSVITADQATCCSCSGRRQINELQHARTPAPSEKAADLLHGIKIAARALADTEAFEQSRRDRKSVPVTVTVVCGSRRGSRDMHPSAANMTPHPTENGIRQNSVGRPTSRAAPRPSCPVHLDHWRRSSNGTMLVVADST